MPIGSGTTFSYGHGSNAAETVSLSTCDIRRLSQRSEPSGTGGRAVVVTTIEGSGLFATSQANMRTDVEKLRRILNRPGGRLYVAFDAGTLVDHASRDHQSGGGQASLTVDAGFGPRMQANVDGIPGASTIVVSWSAELRSYNSSGSPVTGFEIKMEFSIDDLGYSTLTRTGWLTVSRGAAFPSRSSSGGIPSVRVLTPTTALFGGWQSPSNVAANDSLATLGNNPDLYRRFVAGPIFREWRRESQVYAIDESYQKLLFTIVDRENELAYPQGVIAGNVEYEYERRRTSAFGVKSFTAELYGKKGTKKTDLVQAAIKMAQNRIVFGVSGGTGPSSGTDWLQRIRCRELDMLNRVGIVLDIEAWGAERAGPLTTINGEPWKKITESLVTASAAPDAYGNAKLVRLTDFIYDQDAGFTQSPSSLLGVANTSGVALAVTLPTQQIEEAQQSLFPEGDLSESFAEGNKSVVKSKVLSRLVVKSGLVVGRPASTSGLAKPYQIGMPRAFFYEEARVVSVNEAVPPKLPVLPWKSITQEIESGQYGGEIDANGNQTYITRTTRKTEIAVDSALAEVIAAPIGGGSVVWWWPQSIPQSQNPQLSEAAVLPNISLPESGPSSGSWT